VDRGLILENSRGLSVKSAKSRLWVDFSKVQGPLCKNVREFSAGNYFPPDKFVDRSGVLGPPWTDTGADRGHGGALTGAHRRGRKTERGAREARLGSHRSSGGAVDPGDGGAESGGGGAR
jgi:hypothetical protein